MLKDLYIDLIAADANIRRMAKYTDWHCMLINGLCSLLAHELSVNSGYVRYPFVELDQFFPSSNAFILAATTRISSFQV